MAIPTALVNKINSLNNHVIAALESPLHWPLSLGLMTIKVTGRKSGKQYTLPVGYHNQGDAIVVMVSDAKKRQWWRNFQEEAHIEILLKSKIMQGDALVLTPDTEEYKQRAEAFLGRAGIISRIFGIKFDKEQGLTKEQLEALADYAAIVRIKLKLV